MPLGCFRRRAAFELSCGHSVQQNTRGSLQSDTIDLDYIGRGRPWIAMSKLLEHVARNRAYWNDLARQYVEAGERAWAQEEPAWGIWHVPEAELQVFFGTALRQGCYRAGMWHRLHFRLALAARSPRRRDRQLR